MPDRDARRVVVTGAAGHIGSHVMAAFRAAGWQADGVDIVAAPGVTALDLRDPDIARRHLSDRAVIAHCAALPRPTGYAVDAVFATNMALMHSAIAAAEAGGARIVHASSFSVTGLPFAPRPVTLAALPLTERQPAQPQDVYALTKWLSEEMLSAFARRTGGSAISLRLPWVHSAHTFRRDVVPLRDAAASRSHLWAWIDADDAGRAFVAAAEAAIAGHHAVFLSATETFSTRPTADLVAEGWPDTPQQHPFSGHESLIDASLARRLLGFEPAIHWRDYPETA